MSSDQNRSRPGRAARLLAAAGGLAASGLGVLLKALLWGLRGLAGAVALVWRIAGVLDAALWRAVMLAAAGAWRGVSIGGGWVLAAAAGFFGWLPTRAGRAYSAFSSIVLIIAALWIADDLKMAGSRHDGAPKRLHAPVDEADPILARIDGRYVRLSEIAAAARALGVLREDETLTPETAFTRDLVRTYVEQRLLVHAAIDAGLQRAPPVARRIGAARDRILAAEFMESRIREAVTPAAMRALYRSQSGVTKLGDEVRARHILVASKEDADAVIAELAGGASFDELARARSLDRATAPLGGEVGYFSADMMTPAFSRAAFATGAGEIAPPFETEFGWHVVEVLDRRPTQAASFAEVRGEIERFLTLRAIDAALAELAAKSEVVYFDPVSGAAATSPGADAAPAISGAGAEGGAVE